MADNTLQGIRATHPEYNDLSDAQLADGLYKKFYSDMPRSDFDAKIGLQTVAPQAPTPPAAQVPVTSMGRFRTTQDAGSDLPSYERFMKGVKDPIDAGAQILTHALPASVVNAVNSATQSVNDMPVIGPITKALGMVPATNQQINQDITKSDQGYDAARKAQGGGGFDAYRLIGNIAGNAPLAYLAPGATTLPGAIASGAAAGAAGGSLTPVQNAGDDFWSQKLKQIGIGAATGAATGGAGKIIQKTLQPAVNPDVQLLMSKGVTPTPGQIIGGSAARTEEKLTSVPILGDMIKNSQRRAIHQLNVAAYNDALAPIGQKVTTQQIGREGVEAVQQKISAAYNDLLPKLNLQVDGQLASDVNRIASSADTMPPEQAQQFVNIIQNKVGSQLSAGGTMDGATFKTVESELTKLSKQYGADPSAFNKQLGDHVSQLQTALRDTLERSNPQHAGELGKINLAYANFAKVRDAASRLGNENGIFTPAQLHSAVRAGDKSVGKGKFATGNALGQDLSEAGKNVLGATYPNSGTPGRMFLGALLGGGAGSLAMTHPGVPIAAGLSMLPYTGIGQRISAGLLAGQRPQAFSALSAGIGKALPSISQAPVLGLLGRAFGG